MNTEMETCGFCGGPWNECGCNAVDGEGQRNFDEDAVNVEPADEDQPAYEPVESRHSFEILEEKLDWFKQRMAALAKRAAKLGVEAPTYIIGDAFDVKEIRTIDPDLDDEGEPRTITVIVRKYHVEVIGKTPKFSGWTFAATLQHLEGGETLVRNIAKIEAPAEYRNASAKCDHCHTARNRKDTFLVVHDDGTWKQVGRSCIGDFLGAKSPQAIAAQAEYIAEALGFGAAGSCGGREAERVAIEDFLPIVAAVMNAFGWISRTKAKEELKASTANLALDVAIPPKGSKPLRNPRTKARIADEITPECIARATTAIEWVRNITDADANEYLHNCRAIVRSGVVEYRTAGYAASVLIAYDKTMDRVRERAARPESHHIGTIGERLRLRVKQERVIELESERWGATYLHMFTDEAGNDLKWFGSGRLWHGGINGKRVEDGEQIEIVATIKKHDEYKGRPQTLLSRCALYVPPPTKPKKNKTTKAIAQGIVDFFQAVMQPWFVATGIVEAFEAQKYAAEQREQRFGWDLVHLFMSMFGWWNAYEHAFLYGIEQFFREIQHANEREAQLVGYHLAAFFRAEEYSHWLLKKWRGWW